MSVHPDSAITAFVSHDLVHLTGDEGTAVAMPAWLADDLADILERPGLDPAYVALLLHEAAARVRQGRSDGFGYDPAGIHVPPPPPADMLAFARPPVRRPHWWEGDLAAVSLVFVAVVACWLILHTQGLVGP